MFGTILILAVATTVQSVDYSRLSINPGPANNFVLEQYLGDWYIHAFLPPCSWKAIRQYTDFITTYEFQPPNNLQIRLGWRNSGVCNEVVHLLKQSMAPGSYILKDTYGDSVTGDNVIVDTDHRSYAVKWGCTQKDVNKACIDPLVIVKTRARIPHPQTIHIINKILHQRFGMSLDEMVRYTHANVCRPFGEQRKVPFPAGKM